MPIIHYGRELATNAWEHPYNLGVLVEKGT